MIYRYIIYEKRNQTRWLFLNRSKEMNALCKAMLNEITDVLDSAEKDDDIRALVLTGKGKAFCAGADLKEALAEIGLKKGSAEPDFMETASITINRLRRLSKPLIGALNGLTLAGGLEIAMCCDILIAAESAKIGDGHSNFGLFPGGGSASILPRRIGLNRAKYLLLTGEVVPASEMLAYGLVNRVVPDAQLEQTVEALAEKMADKSPLGLKLMKQMALQAMDLQEEAALDLEHLKLKNYMMSYDIVEGLRAFQEKRKPEFKGF
jgi:enoyl-CoA hydratase/carnithine racemase